MNSILSEKLISLVEAAKRLPPGRNGKPTHVSTILRWILHGIRGVKLEAVRCGGRWVTSEEALARFMQRLTPDLQNDAPAPRTPAQRQRASEVAGRELDALLA